MVTAILILKFTLHKIPGLEAPFFLLIVFLSVWLIRCPYTLRRPMSFWSVVESHYLPMQVKPLPQGFLMIFFHRSYTYVSQVFFFSDCISTWIISFNEVRNHTSIAAESQITFHILHKWFKRTQTKSWENVIKCIQLKKNSHCSFSYV